MRELQPNRERGGHLPTQPFTDALPARLYLAIVVNPNEARVAHLERVCNKTAPHFEFPSSLRFCFVFTRQRRRVIRRIVPRDLDVPPLGDRDKPRVMPQVRASKVFLRPYVAPTTTHPGAI